LGEGIIHLYCTENNTRVAAGGNGAEWDSYSPQSIRVNSGQSMTWFNISPVAELQTVSFVENQSYFPPLAAPLSITNDTQITSIMPDLSIEPTI
jgi:hypothetical protein